MLQRKIFTDLAGRKRRRNGRNVPSTHHLTPQNARCTLTALASTTAEIPRGLPAFATVFRSVCNWLTEEDK